MGKASSPGRFPHWKFCLSPGSSQQLPVGACPSSAWWQTQGGPRSCPGTAAGGDFHDAFARPLDVVPGERGTRRSHLTKQQRSSRGRGGSGSRRL